MLERHQQPARGHTLIELTLAMAILSIGILTLISTMSSTEALVEDNQEYALAYAAARKKIEEVRAHTPFSTTYAAYSTWPLNWTTIPDLTTATGILAWVGVSFPNAWNGTSWTLSEQANDTELSMPRDLDGDGVIDAASHVDSTDQPHYYKILPVTVTVMWAPAHRDQFWTWRQVVVSTWVVEK